MEEGTHAGANGLAPPPAPAASAVPVPDHFLGCWISREEHIGRVVNAHCYITVRRCVIDVLDTVTDEVVRHSLPGVLFVSYEVDGVGRKPSYLKVRHGTRVGLYQSQQGSHRVVFSGWSAAISPPADDDDVCISWQTRDDRKRKAPSLAPAAAFPLRRWLRRKDKHLPPGKTAAVLGDPHVVRSLSVWVSRRVPLRPQERRPHSPAYHHRHQRRQLPLPS